MLNTSNVYKVLSAFLSFRVSAPSPSAGMLRPASISEIHGCPLLNYTLYSIQCTNMCIQFTVCNSKCILYSLESVHRVHRVLWLCIAFLTMHATRLRHSSLTRRNKMPSNVQYTIIVYNIHLLSTIYSLQCIIYNI